MNLFNPAAPYVNKEKYSYQKNRQGERQGPTLTGITGYALDGRVQDPRRNLNPAWRPGGSGAQTSASSYVPPDRNYVPPTAGLTPAGRTGLVRGLDARGQVDRSQGDEYKNLLAQYGGQSALEAFAGSKTAPTSVMVGGKQMPTSLADYYGAQQAVGAKNIDSLISDLGYTGNMAQWAKANPALALREYNKKFGNQTPTQGPTAVPTNVGGLDVSKVFSGETPAPWYSQGAAVSAPFQPVVPIQAMKTNMTNTMGDLDLTGKAEEFIRRMNPDYTPRF